jgi:hypothetical protein
MKIKITLDASIILAAFKKGRKDQLLIIKKYAKYNLDNFSNNCLYYFNLH